MIALEHELHTVDPVFWIICALVFVLFASLKLRYFILIRKLQPVSAEEFAAAVLRKYDIDKPEVLKARSRLARKLRVREDRLQPHRKAGQLTELLTDMDGIVLDDLRMDYEEWCRENGTPTNRDEQTIADLVYFIAKTDHDW